MVDAVGKNVDKFTPGDRVFGLRTIRFGTHAEFVCVKQDGSIATMPGNFSFEEAAAVCDGMMYANNYLRRNRVSRRHQHSHQWRHRLDWVGGDPDSQEPRGSRYGHLQDLGGQYDEVPRR